MLKKEMPALHNIICRSRRVGKTDSMILSIISKLKMGYEVAVAGCKDSSDIVDRIRQYNVDVKSKPMTVTKDTKTVQTGFVFCCK